MSTRPYPSETRDAAIADYQAGMTMEQVAAKHGVGSSTVGQWLKVAEIEARPRRIPRPGCTIDGCNLPHRAHGYCGPHYNRVVRGQKPREDGWRPFNPADRIEDLHWMASTGEGLTGAARRIGLRPNALEAWLRKHDHDLLVTLTAQDPLPLNTSRADFHGAGIRVLR